MRIFRLAIGTVALVEIIALVSVMTDDSEGASPLPSEVELFVWELLAMAVAALVLAILPGRWTPIIAALLVLAPIAVAAFLFSLASMMAA